MTDPRPDHRLSDALSYRQGFLSPGDAAAFEAHLAACGACQRTLERVDTFLPQVQQALALPVAEARVDVDALRVQAAQSAVQTRAPSWRPWLWVALATAAAVVIGALAIEVVHHPPPVQDVHGVPRHRH